MYGKMQESGLIEIIPLMINYLGPICCFFYHSESPQLVQSVGLMALISFFY